jgi:hypothetical protein
MVDQAISPSVAARRLAQKLLFGCYFQARPLDYAIYAPGRASGRTVFVEKKPSSRHRWI